MDVQAYRVAVRIALDDQITRNMMQVSRDAIQLNKKFVEMAKNIKAVTSAAKEATSAMRSMNSEMKNQFSAATRGANEYASAMRSAADHAQRASTATRNLPALSGGYGGGSAFPAMAAGAFALSAGSAGGGGGARRGNGLMALPGPQGQGGGWGGWNNGVPPGGWGGVTAAGYAIASSGVEIYRRIKAMAEGKGYDQIASQSAEMSERDKQAHENAKALGVTYKPWSPTQADFDAEKGRYPSVPPKSSSASNQPVNLLLTHEGRQVLVATVIGGMSKQATKAPSSTSAFDSSMLMAYPGQVSKLSTPN